MANTVYHYTPTSWVNGTTPANATNLNHLETQALDVLNGLNPDLFTAFVLSGITCTKDGTIANQLDIASGRAYVTQTDGTLALIVVAADNTHTTTLASQTYYLYLQPDGTWYWNTVNSGFQVNSLFIAQVTTDGSGNINAVTDKRTLLTTPLLNAAQVSIPYVVATALRVHVTSTSPVTVLSYTPSVSGLYRVSAYASIAGTSNGSSVTIQANWTDTQQSAAEASSMGGTTTGSHAPQLILLNGANVGTPGEVSVSTSMIDALAGHAIQVLFLDSAGSAINDYVSATIERLA